MSSITGLGKLVRSAGRYVPFLDRMERRTLALNKTSSPSPPLFIIGLPRSGSTLLYQLFVYYYQTAYFTNISSAFIKAPVTLQKLIKPFFKPYDDKTFKSHYGIIPGLFSPSEAGGIYEYWFENPRIEKIFVRQSVNALSELMNGPFIGKNLRNSFRLEQILQTFPEACFIHVRRNFLYNAQSVYLGEAEELQFKKYMDRYVGNSGSKLERIIHTLKGMDEDITQFFMKNECKRIPVEYEALCDHPLNELNKIADALRQEGILLVSRNRKAIGLKKSSNQKLSPEIWNEMVNLSKK